MRGVLTGKEPLGLCMLIWGSFVLELSLGSRLMLGLRLLRAVGVGFSRFIFATNFSWGSLEANFRYLRLMLYLSSRSTFRM